MRSCPATTRLPSFVVPGIGRLVGHEEIRRFYQASIDRFPVLEVKIVGALDTGDRGAFEWRSVFKDHGGKPFRLKGVNVIRVSGDRLQEVHVYYDPRRARCNRRHGDVMSKRPRGGNVAALAAMGAAGASRIGTCSGFATIGGHGAAR